MSRPEIIIIAAIAEENRVIGVNGQLPWHISEDLKRFKALTTGHTVLMGRKTFESILNRLGKPLPDRRNVVLSTSKTYPEYPEVATFKSFETALQSLANAGKVFIIGGERLFRETLEMADRLELTIVEGDYQGDAFFPEYKKILESRFLLSAEEKKDGFRFVTYDRS